MKKKFRYFFYFYRYLKSRLFLIFFLSVAVGFLDGIGLALFIPLVQLVLSEDSAGSGEDEISQVVLEHLGVEPDLVNILLLIFLLFTLKGVAKFVEGYVRIVYQQYFMRQIRFLNIDLLNDYSYKHFTNVDAGRIQNTLSGEVGRVNLAFRYYFKSFQFGVMVMVYIILALIADPLFSLIVIAGSILINFFFKIYYKKTRKLSKRFTTQSHLFEGLLIQRISFFDYLKTTGASILFSNKLKRSILDLEKDQRRMGLIDSLLISLREPLIIVVVVTAIGLQLFLFEKEIAVILLSLMLLYRAVSFFMAMQEQWNMFLGLTGSLENLEDFSKEFEQGREERGTAEYEGLKEKITLRNISFGYDHNSILKNLNLEIEKNETVAFIGESGSGKTTLLKIISGLLLPSAGTILIDGTALKDIDPYSFRKRVGYIPQEVPIFSATVYDNVTLWAEKTENNIDRFKKALKEASIFDFIYGRPEQEETILGNNGINLSGGQRQRLAIARELFKEVDFLFLDEATSALDSETEALVQENIMKLKGKMTIVVISHRLSTIKSADRIVMLNKGKVEMMGKFDELLQNSDQFKRIVELQT